jgi:hypothetical protein
MAFLHQRKAELRRMLLDFLRYQVLFLLIDMVLHETSHALAALAVGVPVTAIGIGRNGFSPVVYTTVNLSATASAIVSYAGGAGSTAVFLVIFAVLWFRKRRFSRTVPDWTLGAALLSRIVLSLLAGLLEGAFSAAYFTARTIEVSPSSLLLNTANIFAVIAAVIVYARLSPFGKIKAERLG